MPIDACSHDFATLAKTVLPAHMRKLKGAIRSPMPMADFSSPGIGVRSLLAKHDHDDDFSGCYVLLDPAPLYVGISRRVFSRLRQHVMGRTHFDASLAYRMAQKAAPHEKTRTGAMEDAGFQQVFETKRTYLRGLHVAMIPIENPVELYLFEVYAALSLGTAEWNTFRTH